MSDRRDAPETVPPMPPKDHPDSKPEESNPKPDNHDGTGALPMHAGDAPDVD